METDLNKIRKLSKEKEDENWEFRSFLKGCDISEEKIDSIVHELYQKVSSEIDCRTCANCCKEVQPVLDQEDIERFVKCSGISVAQFKDRYLVKDEGPEKFVFNKKPCPFLKDNLCSHYDFRPKDCRSYPHIHKRGFIFRLVNVIENSSICPIVFNVYESLKDEIKYYDDS
ncbi:MAG: YkgJ family cysteine cluster protein [Candidatus Methanoperedens sp.]|nr:YkgJ family cysteine cluster protein [Candidatus Methanoperedens sp.]